MKTNSFMILVACAGLLGSCTTKVPKELVNTRESYQRASTGSAVQIASTELHEAHQAFAQIEPFFEENSDSYRMRELANVDQRTSEIAYELAINTLASLLSKLATVKKDYRGIVIKLSDSALFASNQAIFLTEVRTRLNQVADILLTTREHTLVIEGYTDSWGSASHNLVLSLHRAYAFRAYLIRRGYKADRIRAYGLGEENPIADNASAEGRAQNRRVEIIIERELYASNQ